MYYPNRITDYTNTEQQLINTSVLNSRLYQYKVIHTIWWQGYCLEQYRPTIHKDMAHTPSRMVPYNKNKYQSIKTYYPDIVVTKGNAKQKLTI
jgi:hypothetical protein